MPEPYVMLSQERIEEFLAHRGRNLVLDSVSSNGSEGESTLSIARGDVRGRDYFLHEVPGRGTCVHPMALIEHVALSGTVIYGPPPGMIALFSRVRKCTWLDAAREGEKLNSFMKKKRSPKPFHRFQSTTTGEDGRTIMTSDIMAFEMEASEVAAVEMDETRDLPGRDPAQIAARFPGRNPDFVFIDAPLEMDLDKLSGTFAYTYRTDHPLTEGHFPHMPVMMGITQALAICDAAQWLVGELHASGRLPESSRVDVKGALCRSDGSAACEVPSLSTECLMNGQTPVLELKGARTISFRNSVTPPDPLIVNVELSIES